MQLDRHPGIVFRDGRAPDEESFVAAVAEARALVTENVHDFRHLEGDALSRGEVHATLVFTSNRQFPRGAPGTIGRLVEALDALLREDSMPRVHLHGRDRDLRQVL